MVKIVLGFPFKPCSPDYSDYSFLFSIRSSPARSFQYLRKDNSGRQQGRCPASVVELIRVGIGIDEENTVTSPPSREGLGCKQNKSAMATMNPFDLLVDDDNGDPTQLIFVPQEKPAAKKTPPSAQTLPAKLPSKPLPPAQAVREARNEGGGRGGRGARGGRSYQDGGFSNRGRGNFNGGRNFNRDNSNYNSNTNNGYPAGGRGSGAYQGIEDGSVRQEDGEFGRSSERWRGGYGGGGRGGGGRGGRGFGGRGGFTNGAADETERPRRQYERRSGTGRGYEIKREGAGRGNWGTETDQGFLQESEELSHVMEEKSLAPEKQLESEDNQEADAEIPAAETEVKKQEEEDKEMTLDEYEKLLEEKRKALLAMKVEERRVDVDKEFESMQQLTVKRDNDDVFIKLGSEKEIARKNEIAEREERTRKAVSINEFLKPTEGEKYYAPGGRGRGRGRGDRGGFRGGFDGGSARPPAVPRIEDPGQFPTLGGK